LGTTLPTPITRPRHNHWTKCGLHGETSLTTAFQRNPTTVRTRTSRRNLQKARFQDDPPATLHDSSRLLLNLRHVSRDFLFYDSRLPSVDFDRNLNLHDALLGFAEYPTP